MLPGEDDNAVPIPKRNILPILINSHDELMVDGELIEISNLKGLTIAFLDNGGDQLECDYCQGEGNPESSDNPDKAIVSLMNNRETSYGMYVTVQNELVAAYNFLRNRESQRLYKTDFHAMQKLYKNPSTSQVIKKELKDRIRTIQKLFPMKLSEAERN
ncbi:biopolymer transporter ExbD [Maribacter sp. 2210JD10-5]|uniref:biopolymer transporter ExbD n=1 Tax=Maribacter sp. 2210JD10-5 TaxID=3386272 RepID=UPI0039BC5566